MKREVLIIGCGIAGPAAAIFLKRAGFSPVIFEAMPRHDDYAGLFLNIGRNGVRILKEMGVDGPVRQEGIAMHVMRFRNGRGKVLGDVGTLRGNRKVLRSSGDFCTKCCAKKRSGKVFP